MACTAPGQGPPPRPMCLRSWETHQSPHLWPQPQVLASAVGWEILVSNVPWIKDKTLDLDFFFFKLNNLVRPVTPNHPSLASPVVTTVPGSDFFLKGQTVNICGHMVSFQLCLCNMKAATDSTENEYGCVFNKTLLPDPCSRPLLA